MTRITAELKSLGSVDTGEDPTDPTRLLDLEGWSPDERDRFQIVVAAEIGPAGDPGADVFYVDVCSPSWLVDQPLEKGFRWGHPYLFLERWDYEVLRRAIDDRCRQTSGRDWDEVAVELSRYFHWEFAGMDLE
jgi:hypothetical protein